MAVAVIIEFKAKPGQRTALLREIERIGEEFGPTMTEYGNQSLVLYEALDDPDLLVEIAEWVSVEAREAMSKEAQATGAFASMIELLAAPPRATYVRRTD